MTQQNETEQQGAAEQEQPEPPAPARSELAASGQRDRASQAGPQRQPGSPPPPGAFQQPGTPYQSAQAAPVPALYGYESVPEAYLAPPQPGQPRYGTPSYPGGGRPVAGRPGYGQPGYGQPPGGQAGYGKQAPARPGAAALRDPALASPWQRLVAQAIDWIIIFAVSIIAFWSQLSVAGREAEALVGRYPDLNTPAAQAALRNSSFEHALMYWFLGVLGIALAYYWVQHAAWGATLGKRTFGIRVVRAADRSRLDARAAGLRTAASLAGPAIFLLLLFISPASALGGVLWAADSSLPLLDARAQSLHDKLAGTVVVNQRALDEAARQPSAW